MKQDTAVSSATIRFSLHMPCTSCTHLVFPRAWTGTHQPDSPMLPARYSTASNPHCGCARQASCGPADPNLQPHSPQCCTLRPTPHMITQASYTITVAASLTATPGTTCPTCCLLNQQTPESASDVTQPSYGFTCGPRQHNAALPQLKTYIMRPRGFPR